MKRSRERKALALGLVVLTSLGWGPCSSGVQERVEMRVVGGQLERTVANVDSHDFADWRAQDLEELYGPHDANGRFRGHFRRLPPDFGGAGGLLHSSSPMGTVHAYRERLQGLDAPSQVIEHLAEGAEELRELADGWIPAELGNTPVAALAETLLFERWIPDLQDVALYHWLFWSGLIDAGEHEQRVLQFLSARGYDSPSYPRLKRDELPWKRALLARLERDGLRLDPEQSEALNFLASRKLFDASVARQLARSARFRSWLRSPPSGLEPELAELVAAGYEALEPFARGELAQSDAVKNAMNVYLMREVPSVGCLLSLATDGVAAGVPDSIEIRLKLPVAPFATNGRWDASQRRIEWEPHVLMDKDLRVGKLDPAYRFILAYLPLSSHAHALWAEPDARFQKARFGRVLLQDRALADYNDWYRELGEERRAYWDAWVASLEPGTGLLQQITAFHFEDESAGPGSRAQPALDLLTTALTGAQVPGS